MRRLAALALLLGAAGCVSLAPAYHRPAAPVPATVANSEPGAAQSTTLPTSWRAFFVDPRLRQVIEQGLANNRDLPAAVANVQIARAAWLSQRAQLFPSLNAQGAANGSQTPASVLGFPGVSGAFTQRTYTAELAVPAYELDLFGRVRNLTKAARERYFASQSARDAAQISLVAQVAQGWLAIGADRSLLATGEQTLAEANNSLALTQAEFDHGVLAQSDVDRARALVALARFDVARYATQVAQDRDGLALVVGAPVADDLLPTGVNDEAGVMGQLPTGVASSVLLQRPDVVEAEHQLKAANANIGAARAAFFPSIALTGSDGFASAALSTLFSGGSQTWSYAAQLTQPIFDAGANRAGLLQAKGERSLAQANYEKAIQTAFRDVADALAQRSEIDAELSAQEAQVSADADALRLVEAQFRRGTASELDLLSAEATLYAAQQTLTSARLLEASNLATLYQALGGGL